MFSGQSKSGRPGRRVVSVTIPSVSSMSSTTPYCQAKGCALTRKNWRSLVSSYAERSKAHIPSTGPCTSFRPGRRWTGPRMRQWRRCDPLQRATTGWRWRAFDRGRGAVCSRLRCLEAARMPARPLQHLRQATAQAASSMSGAFSISATQTAAAQATAVWEGSGIVVGTDYKQKLPPMYPETLEIDKIPFRVYPSAIDNGKWEYQALAGTASWIGARLSTGALACRRSI